MLLLNTFFYIELLCQKAELMLQYCSVLMCNVMVQWNHGTVEAMTMALKSRYLHFLKTKN